jgi:hypothetical protein
MDMEFIVQDTFSLTRPQWKLATTFDEASKAFQLAVAQDQKNAGLDKNNEPDDASSEASSDDDGVEGDGDIVLPEPDDDGESETGDEEDVDVGVLWYTLACRLIAANFCNRMPTTLHSLRAISSQRMKPSS